MSLQDEPALELSAAETAFLTDLFRVGVGDAEGDAAQEAFIQRVMRSVQARQRRALLFDTLPLLMGAALLMAAMLLPVFDTLPMLLAGSLSELPAFITSIEWDSGTLLPLAAVLLAALLPGLLDAVTRMLD